MFLRPHHFLAVDQSSREATWLGDQLVQHYGWGLRSIDIDCDALSNSQLVIRALQARLRDGTLVRVPDDVKISDVNLRPAFESSPGVTVFLGLPVLSPWRQNVSEPGSTELTRYVRETTQVEDLGPGASPQSVDFLNLNVKVMAGDREPDGYDLIPMARLRKPSRDDPPQLDEAYIPPLIACDAWGPLQGGVLQSVYNQLGAKLTRLASQAESRGITFDTRYQGDAATLAQIGVLNEAVAALGVIAFAEGVHPLTAYLELCRIAGRLAIFGASRRVADLPRYDHDDLGRCFFGAKDRIKGLIDQIADPTYSERTFVGAGTRMQVALEPSWVEPGWRMFIGVRSSLPAQDCADLLTLPGRLDMKIGSSDQVDSIYRLGRSGLHFRYAPYPPRVMPAPPDTVFFQLDRDRHPDEWPAVERSLTLAIRLSEKLVAGDFQGKSEVSIRSGNLATTMQFTLYMVPDGGKA
jgi:type VI secretion system protein ImpJ